MNAPEPSVVLVVGVGRSGTSLAMQALRRLGAVMSEQMVPPSPTNRRGALEDWDVRDAMMALWRDLGRFEGLRPSGWDEQPATRQAAGWLEDYLSRVSQRPGEVFACKYPLASLFLPIWLEAAERSEVRLTVIWATRKADAVIASQQRSYRPGAQQATVHFCQRTLYLLQDLPAETLLLPYEGWRSDPVAQLRSLARAARLPLGSPSTALHDLYDPREDHSSAGDLGVGELPAIVRAADEAMAGRLGLLAKVVTDTDRDAIVRGLMETVMHQDSARRLDDQSEAPWAEERGPDAEPSETEPSDSKQAQAPAPSPKAASILRDERDRLREDVARLRDERDTARGESARLRAVRDRLRERAEAAEGEATRLKKACEALVEERDRGDGRVDDMASRHALATSEVERRLRKSQDDLRAVRVKASAAAATQQAKIERLAKRDDAARERLKKLRRTARKKTQALSQRVEKAEAEATGAGRARDRLERRVKRMAEELATARAERDRARGTLRSEKGRPATPPAPPAAAPGWRGRLPSAIRRGAALPRRLARAVVRPRPRPRPEA